MQRSAPRLRSRLRKRAATHRLADGSALPAPGEIQFYANCLPGLPNDTYTISVTQTVSGPGGAGGSSSSAATVSIQGPQFSLDTGSVVTIFPPDNGAGTFDAQFPYVVLADATLPWERDADPANTSSVTTPWLALLVLAEGDFVTDPSLSGPLNTVAITDLLATSPTLLGPTGLQPVDTGGSCQTIIIPGSVFLGLAPGMQEIPLLSHCRAINDSGAVSVYSVVTANRLPVAGSAAVRYYAHLVSLEGFSTYLATPTNQSPTLPYMNGDSGQGYVNVQLVSLANWIFVSQPAPLVTFDQLMAGLVASQSPTAALALPVPASAPQPVLGRLTDGFVALDFAPNTGETTFAWYRGPFTAQPAQPLPAVGTGQVPVSQAASADALAIYLAGQGIFDLSYAAAWAMGRALALANGTLAGAMPGFRRRARQAVRTLLARRHNPLFADADDPATLLAPGAARRRLARLAQGGRRDVRIPRPDRAAVRALLAEPRAAAALAGHLDAAGATATVTNWLGALQLLSPVPFSSLVPHPASLPPEALRFFYVDADWIDALVAGALSIGVQTGLDLDVQAVLTPTLRAAAGTSAVAGMVIRSQLVSAYPDTQISASAGGSAVTVLRDDILAADIRLTLFAAVPDAVQLSEPYHAFTIGPQDEGIALRAVSGGDVGQPTGAYLANSTPASLAASYARPGSSLPGALGILGLANALAAPLGLGDVGTATAIDAGELALQLVCLPEQETFTG